jgi:hypothetical protein
VPSIIGLVDRQVPPFSIITDGMVGLGHAAGRESRSGEEFPYLIKTQRSEKEVLLREGPCILRVLCYRERTRCPGWCERSTQPALLRLRFSSSQAGGKIEEMAVIDVSEERRKRRRAGDPRLSAEGREVLARISTGDLADEFQAALDADLESDPILGGHPDVA